MIFELNLEAWIEIYEACNSWQSQVCDTRIIERLLGLKA